MQILLCASIMQDKQPQRPTLMSRSLFIHLKAQKGVASANDTYWQFPRHHNQHRCSSFPIPAAL